MSGISIEFILFGLTLAGVAYWHRYTLRVALLGLAAIAAYKIIFTGFPSGPGAGGFVTLIAHEWVILANLLCLLTGFAVLERHFESSHLSLVLPRYLPGTWKGGFVMLAMVWVLSSFLDNIAGALIGGAMAHQLFRGKVHVGYLAAIVAASNAGGTWSVVGDTTTTMMWIAGVSPTQVLSASLPSAVALFIFGIPAAIQQHRYSPMLKRVHKHQPIDWSSAAIVALIIIFAISTNVIVNTKLSGRPVHFPFIGSAVWFAILLSAVWRRPDSTVVVRALKGSLFLLALVLCASMMPVENLPSATWYSTLGLGFLSAVFDNIPLTALAIKQGNYDWAFLAYAVGFGGSMIWFGSSSGVAISNLYREARSVGSWLRHAWYLPVAYVVGFLVMLAVFRWQPDRAAGVPQPAQYDSAFSPYKTIVEVWLNPVPKGLAEGEASLTAPAKPIA